MGWMGVSRERPSAEMEEKVEVGKRQRDGGTSPSPEEILGIWWTRQDFLFFSFSLFFWRGDIHVESFETEGGRVLVCTSPLLFFF